MSGFNMLLGADGRGMNRSNGMVNPMLPNPATFDIPPPPMSLAFPSASATNGYNTSHPSTSPDARQALVNLNDISANLNDPQSLRQPRSRFSTHRQNKSYPTRPRQATEELQDRGRRSAHFEAKTDSRKESSSSQPISIAAERVREDP